MTANQRMASKAIIRQGPSVFRTLLGSVAVLLDADSVEVTRGFANGLGRFRIHAPRAGTYWLRTERIGYRSVVSASIVLGDGESVELEFPVEPVLVRLAP